MARIPGVSPREAGPEVAGTLGYAREMMAQLAEHAPERGAEPIKLLAPAHSIR
jgi:hypothetical protein